ncbi:hypothetical protein IG631_21142 [Alternaria alternata]|nr:hypothetical protein IG631_21142 [Alternaria alternata]
MLIGCWSSLVRPIRLCLGRTMQGSRTALCCCASELHFGCTLGSAWRRIRRWIRLNHIERLANVKKPGNGSSLGWHEIK